MGVGDPGAQVDPRGWWRGRRGSGRPAPGPPAAAPGPCGRRGRARRSPSRRRGPRGPSRRGPPCRRGRRRRSRRRRPRRRPAGSRPPGPAAGGRPPARRAAISRGRGGVALGAEDRHVVAGRERRPAELAGALEAVLRALGHRPTHDLVEGRRQVRRGLGEPRRGLGQVGLKRGRLVARGEGRPAGEGVEEDAPERVDVGAGVDRAAADLLGGEVGEGAGPAATGRRRARPTCRR